MTEDQLDDLAMEVAEYARARAPSMESAAGVLYQASFIIVLNYLPLENVHAFVSSMMEDVHARATGQIAVGMAGGEVTKQ